MLFVFSCPVAFVIGALSVSLFDLYGNLVVSVCLYASLFSPTCVSSSTVSLPLSPSLFPFFSFRARVAGPCAFLHAGQLALRGVGRLGGFPIRPAFHPASVAAVDAERQLEVLRPVAPLFTLWVLWQDPRAACAALPAAEETCQLAGRQWSLQPGICRRRFIAPLLRFRAVWAASVVGPGCLWLWLWRPQWL